MNDIAKRKEDLQRAEAVRRMATIQMPEEIANLVFDYLKAYRDTLCSSKLANSQVEDLDQLAFANPIELIDIEYINYHTWAFSAEGINFFKLDIGGPEQITGVDDAVFWGTLPPREERTEEWVTKFVNDNFTGWMEHLSKQQADPSEFSFPIAMLGYMVAYLAVHATEFTHITGQYHHDLTHQYKMPDTFNTKYIVLRFYTDFWKSKKDER
jgi:hypothetical protein